MSLLGARWRARERDARFALGGLVALVAGAIAVRAWLMVSYGPGFLGFADSAIYALATIEGSFRDIQHPAGYSLFLSLADHISHRLSFTIAMQHASGVVAGLLLYKAVVRTGAPAWLGLAPAAVVFFGGTGLLLEHSLLADSLLSFLQALVVYLAVRALYDRRLRWPLLVGIVIGFSIWVKIAAISDALLIPVVLLCATPAGVRRRLLSALVLSVAVIVMVVAYTAAQYGATGHLRYVPQGSWALYGRVATFVDCSTFTPPRGSSFLCPPEPVGDRQSQGYYEFSPTSPAVERFGAGYYPTPHADKLLDEFSIAAIEHEPVAYAKAIASGLGRYVFPSSGEGSTPEQLRQQLLGPVRAAEYKLVFERLYPNARTYSGSTSQIRSLSLYERYTRVQGPLLIILLVVASAGLLVLPARTRWAAALFTLTAMSNIVFAVAGDGYDARYAYPTFGPLAAGAALGVWGIRSRLVDTVQRRRGIARPEISLDSSRTV